MVLLNEQDEEWQSERDSKATAVTREETKWRDERAKER